MADHSEGDAGLGQPGDVAVQQLLPVQGLLTQAVLLPDVDLVVVCPGTFAIVTLACIPL